MVYFLPDNRMTSHIIEILAKRPFQCYKWHYTSKKNNWYGIGIYLIKLTKDMTVVNKLIVPKESEEKGQDWENPSNPEKAEDNRDVEQLIRQKDEAERRKSNLSDSDEEIKKTDKK